jgi:hypothetical protein
MAFAREQREALHLLEAIEGGIVPVADVGSLIDDADPALVYLVVTWLRHRYGGDHPAAAGVIGRVVELTTRHEGVKAKMREGKVDPVVTWFEEAYAYRDFEANGFIELIVDKLET